MPYSSSGRILAPLALLAATLALVLIISGSRGDEDTRRAPAATAPAAKAPAKPRRSDFTRVKPGETFSAIAERVGVPVQLLIDLNPGADPQSLRAGQRVRVRQ